MRGLTDAELGNCTISLDPLGGNPGFRTGQIIGSSLPSFTTGNLGNDAITQPLVAHSTNRSRHARVAHSPTTRGVGLSHTLDLAAISGVDLVHKLVNNSLAISPKGKTVLRGHQRSNQGMLIEPNNATTPKSIRSLRVQLQLQLLNDVALSGGLMQGSLAIAVNSSKSPALELQTFQILGFEGLQRVCRILSGTIHSVILIVSSQCYLVTSRATSSTASRYPWSGYLTSHLSCHLRFNRPTNHNSSSLNVAVTFFRFRFRFHWTGQGEKRRVNSNQELVHIYNT
jgi:hypothetical protein